MHWIAVVSTAYCLSGVMADGTPVRTGSVANNAYRLGTRIEVDHSPYGRRSFVVRDRIGWGTQLDFWVPSCSRALLWGRRVVRLRLQYRNPLMPAVVRLGIDYERAAALAYRHAHQLPGDQNLAHAQGG